MYSNRPSSRFGGGGMGGGLTGPVPTDIWLLLGVILLTFSLRFFAATATLAALLQLTPLVWMRGFVWQLVTYPFAGAGAPGFWFVLELLILFMFGRDVYVRLGRKGFWRLLISGAVVAAVAAVAIQLLLRLGGSLPGPAAFALMQGQHMLLVILIAAFATLNAEATIYLFFVLPIQARWFLGLEILFAFLGFLNSRDLAGFLGICVVVGFTWMTLTPGSGQLSPREGWLRLQAWWIKLRLGWMKKRRGFTVVKGEKRDGDPWVH
jgi:hypothetical protein